MSEPQGKTYIVTDRFQPPLKQCAVFVREGVEYLYVGGIDINEIRIPADERLLKMLQELIHNIVNKDHLC